VRTAKSFVLAEACVSRTHRRHQRCRPTVLKTVTITGPHALPDLQVKICEKKICKKRFAIDLTTNDKRPTTVGPNYFGCATTRR
jgi:hypothetical protein